MKEEKTVYILEKQLTDRQIKVGLIVKYDDIF